MNLDSFKDVRATHNKILCELLKWIKSYYLNKNIDIITCEKSLEIHNLLNEIKWGKLTNKEIEI